MLQTYISNSAKPEYIFLHGWLSNKYIYQDVIHNLPANKKAAAIDLPGFGDNNYAEKFEINSYLEAINAQITKLTNERVILFGTSMGATLALLYSQKYPENVKSLILRVPYINNAQFKLMPISLVKLLFKLSSHKFVLKLFKIPAVLGFRIINRPFSENKAGFKKVINNLKKMNLNIAHASLAYLFAHDFKKHFLENKKKTLLILAEHDELFSNNFPELNALGNYKIVATKKHGLFSERTADLIKLMEEL